MKLRSPVCAPGRRVRAWLAAVTLPALLSASPAVQDLSPEQARELTARVDELYQRRSTRRHLEEKLAAERERRSAEIRRLEEDLAKTRRELEAARATREDTEQRTAELEQQIAGHTSRLRDAVAAASPVARAAAQRLSPGLEELREDAGANLAQAQDLLGAADPREGCRGVTVLLGFLVDELQRARAVEVQSRPMPVPGEERVVPASVLRFGLVQELWIAEDGSVGAWFDGNQWVRAAAPDLERIHAALERARRREPPGLELLPFGARGGSAALEESAERGGGS